MKKFILIFLVLLLIPFSVFGQTIKDGSFDPTAARKSLNNIDATATPTWQALTLTDKVQAAWADIRGNLYASGSAYIAGDIIATGDVEISGDLSAVNASFTGNIQSDDTAILTNASLSGNIDVVGDVSAVNASFTGVLQILGQTQIMTQIPAVYEAANTTNVTATYTEILDNLSELDPTTGIVTLDSAGYYQVSAMAEWESNATGKRVFQIIKDSSVSILNTTTPAVSGDITGMTGVWSGHLAAGATLYMRTYQSSGGGLDINKISLSVLRIQ